MHARPLVLLRALVLLSCIASIGPARAWWDPAGNPICVATGAQHDPICRLPWITWTDERGGTPQLYAALLAWHTGETFRTPANGIAIAPSSTPQQTPVAELASIDASLIVAWSEDRGTGSGPDIYAMRLRLADGMPDPGWPAGGLLVCGAVGAQDDPRVLLHYDSTDPFHPILLFYVSWRDARDGTSRIHVTHATGAGALAAGWPADGILVSSEDADHRNVALVGEGDGCVAIWESAGRVVAQAVSGTGTVPANDSWPAAGRTLSDPAFPASGATAAQYYRPSALGDQVTLVAWLEQRDGLPQVRAQGWWDGANGNIAPTSLAVVDDESARPAELHLLPDPTSYDHSHLYWRDVRHDAGDAYLTDLYAPGSFMGPQLYAYPPSTGTPIVVNGGEQAHVTGMRNTFWQDARSGTPQIYTPFYGRVALSDFAQTQPSASWSTTEGWIPEGPPPPDVVVWTDARNAATAPDVYAQVMGPGGPGTVGVGDPIVSARVECSLPQPTPTRGAVSFRLSTPRDGPLELDIVDLGGRVVRPLASRYLPAGRNAFVWDGNDASGRRAAPGLYWIRGRAGEESFSRRIVMLGR